jgi:hypothetical protein
MILLMSCNLFELFVRYELSLLRKNYHFFNFLEVHSEDITGLGLEFQFWW